MKINLFLVFSFSGPAKVKFPLYNEKDQCIIFDAGILDRVKRQMIIRVHFNNIIYVFESDLGALKKLSDGHRHRVGLFLSRNSSSWVFFSSVIFYTESRSGSTY